MKTILCLLLTCSSIISFAQRESPNNNTQFYNRTFEYDYVERKPVFVAGTDSLKRFYISHFNAFDSLVERCINKGDTAKYIRVYFDFIIDENGIPYSPEFSYIASSNKASSTSDKKLKYFNDLKNYFNDAVKTMIKKMPNWRPALQNNVRVKCNVRDYFQIWLGINPEH
ncbi:MAG: hypothetical protein H3C56_08080 [Chitinophagaceae bacterium]|nr:hypothetical protein [Chitinophagaceae bacterium]